MCKNVCQGLDNLAVPSRLAKGPDAPAIILYFLLLSFYKDLDNPAVPSKLKALTLLDLMDRERANGRVRSREFETNYLPLARSGRLQWLGR